MLDIYMWTTPRLLDVGYHTIHLISSTASKHMPDCHLKLLQDRHGSIHPLRHKSPLPPLYCPTSSINLSSLRDKTTAFITTHFGLYLLLGRRG